MAGFVATKAQLCDAISLPLKNRIHVASSPHGVGARLYDGRDVVGVAVGYRVNVGRGVGPGVGSGVGHVPHDARQASRGLRPFLSKRSAPHHLCAFVAIQAHV